MSRRYTQEELEFLREEYRSLTIPELTKAFNERFGLNKKDTTIHSILAYYGIKCGRPPSGRKLRKGKRYTHEQLHFLESGYKRMTLHNLTQAFNREFDEERTSQGIHGTLLNHGLAGSRSQNMHYSYPRDIGSERICNNTGFVVIKVAEASPYRGGKSQQRHKHKVVWEEHNGPIPSGHTIRFLDGNKQNCEIENLILFTRAENFHLNLMGFDKAPSELKESIILRARLICKIGERKQELDYG